MFDIFSFFLSVTYFFCCCCCSLIYVAIKCEIFSLSATVINSHFCDSKNICIFEGNKLEIVWKASNTKKNKGNFFFTSFNESYTLYGIAYTAIFIFLFFFFERMESCLALQNLRLSDRYTTLVFSFSNIFFFYQNEEKELVINYRHNTRFVHIYAF